MRYRIVLFDVDGVLIIPLKMFSVQYCEKYGIDLNKLEQFYLTKEFQDSGLGKFDLKDAIRIHNDKWQWSGEPDELLRLWFEGENHPNEKLLKIVQELRENGFPVYIATQQEKYRAKYLKDVVFDNKVDGMFVSHELGVGKHTPDFWDMVLSSLTKSHPDVKPSDIAYFDDKQSLVDLARSKGIDAYLYTKLEDVETALGI